MEFTYTSYNHLLFWVVSHQFSFEWFKNLNKSIDINLQFYLDNRIYYIFSYHFAPNNWLGMGSLI